MSLYDDGAGRRMSRTQAVKTLNLKEEQDRLVGIYNNMKTQKSLDEFKLKKAANVKGQSKLEVEDERHK